MIHLNAGNLWTESYLDKVIALNKAHAGDGIQVRALFGSIAEITPTARSFDRIPSRDWDFVERYVDKAQSNDINIRYTLNMSCIGNIQHFKADWDERLWGHIMRLYSLGVHEWTITSPLVVELLHNEHFKDIFIEVSTIAEVATVEDAVRWRELGADGVNVSTSINRDFHKLRSINAALVAAVLANEACLYRCPWRRECYNLSSHDSRRTEHDFGFYPFRRCNELRMAEPVEWLKSRMVLPQWMRLYQTETGISWYKVAFRTHPEEVAIPILEAYMNQNFKGNWCELWPTIAHLGNTDEPVAMTNISSEVLDELGFINRWLKGVNDCAKYQCGLDCTYCYRMYERAAKR